MSSTATPQDETENNLLATGSLAYALMTVQTPALLESALITDDAGNATNQLSLRFSHLKSAYRLTVERIPDTERSDEEPF